MTFQVKVFNREVHEIQYFSAWKKYGPFINESKFLKFKPTITIKSRWRKKKEKQKKLLLVLGVRLSIIILKICKLQEKGDPSALKIDAEWKVR